MVGRRAAWLVFANRTKPLETGLRGCGCSADRTGLHGANSRLSGKRTGNLVNSRDRDHLPANKHPTFQTVFGKIPCKNRTGNSFVEPGILFVEPGNFKCENGKSAQRPS